MKQYAYKMLKQTHSVLSLSEFETSVYTLFKNFLSFTRHDYFSCLDKNKK